MVPAGCHNHASTTFHGSDAVSPKVQAVQHPLFEGNATYSFCLVKRSTYNNGYLASQKKCGLHKQDNILFYLPVFGCEEHPGVSSGRRVFVVNSRFTPEPRVPIDPGRWVQGFVLGRDCLDAHTLSSQTMCVVSPPGSLQPGCWSVFALWNSRSHLDQRLNLHKVD